MAKRQQYANGRFAPGNKLGKGRPPAATQRERLEALLSVCSDADWRAVCKRAVRDAVAGDRHSRQWLASYLLPAAGAAGIAQAGEIEIELYDGYANNSYANGGWQRALDAIAPPGAHDD